jgi:hypothetical protein
VPAATAGKFLRLAEGSRLRSGLELVVRLLDLCLGRERASSEFEFELGAIWIFALS